ncbi:ester cyclase [Yangia mangrovi]|uniref:Ester cyclase n=1 Tax=Alloyangia mangrovi TaxID=1779329 RepID=A0A2A3JWG3_9RHOB|nr:ester cyclase [Alloyangia mangrovi]MCT4370728.1 ester cyclase [Alloyangia mangrovi]
MAPEDLAALYRGYIACLNRQDWKRLGDFVADAVAYNGERIGLAGYRRMLENDFAAIPDLSFEVALLACEPPQIASRLEFDCTPVGRLFGLPVNGRRVRFAENVFYRVKDARIAEVWSVIDKSAIEAQLQTS